MIPPEPADLLRQVLEARVRLGTPTPECLDDDTVAALADGTLDVAVRAAVLSHVGACPPCRSAVGSVAQALADPAVAREVAGAQGARRRLSWIALPLAAAAVLLLVTWPPPLDELGPVHRAPPITAATTPVPLAPIGAVAEADVLRWSAVAGADRYRVTLFDAAGRVVYEARLTDTVTALPDSVALAPGRPYLWKVEARTGFDRWAASELVEFSIAGRRPR